MVRVSLKRKLALVGVTSLTAVGTATAIVESYNVALVCLMLLAGVIAFAVLDARKRFGKIAANSYALIRSSRDLAVRLDMIRGTITHSSHGLSALRDELEGLESQVRLQERRHLAVLEMDRKGRRDHQRKAMGILTAIVADRTGKQKGEHDPGLSAGQRDSLRSSAQTESENEVEESP